MPTTALAYLEFVAQRRAEVDAALDRWLPRPPACPPAVAEAMRYAVGSGGKRMRPVLTLAAADAVAAAAGADDAALAEARRLALPAACAIELVHTQSLVHDDLPAMDDDVLRRGLPTVHVRYGEGLAILVGDGLLAEAFGLLAREPEDVAGCDRLSRKLRVIAMLGDTVGAGGMVGGQALDLAHTGSAATRDTCDLPALVDMHARKTGGLIRAAAVAGAVMAGADETSEAALATFGARVGLAFQIVDDILDVEGTEDAIGKTVGKDAHAAKPTYETLLGCERARAAATDAVDEAIATLAQAGLATVYLTAFARSVVTRIR
jgi:geranylgeranyl pyrophosphate synthase